MLAAAPHSRNIAQALSIKFNNLVYEMQSRGEDVIVLSLGEAFFSIPLFDFAEVPLPAAYHYSHSRGNAELRRLLAAYHGREHQLRVDPDTEIIVTAGSKIAIHMSLMAILSPGDEVLVLEPAWVSYTEQVKLCHGVPVMVPRDVSVFGLEAFVTPQTRAVIVNNPNNPSGKVYSRAELEHLHALAEREGLFLLSDEAYSQFVLDDSFISCGALDPEKKHTIVCNSMSKNHGISGWRIGYAIAGRHIADEVLKINQHLVTCPPSILEHYLVRNFESLQRVTAPQVRDVVLRRRALAGFLDSCGLAYMPGDATFYFFVSIAPSTLTSDEFCTRLLREHGVSTVPGIGYGRSCDRFIRVSVGTESMERTQEGIRRIRRLVEESSPSHVQKRNGDLTRRHGDTETDAPPCPSPFDSQQGASA